MFSTTRKALAFALSWCLAASPLFAAVGPPKKATSAAGMDESQRAVHALNRLAFGPRPGDVERVRAMGVDKWIEQQLEPQKIDDSQTEARLAPFRTLKMDAREMMENFPSPQVLKAIANGKMSLPSDPQKRAVYESALAGYKQRQAQQAAKKSGNGADAAAGDGEQNGDAQMEDTAERREMRREARQKGEELLAQPPEERYNAILRMPAEERRMAVVSLKEDERAKLLDGMTPEQREQLQAMARPQAIVVDELSQAKLLRAIYSERQLEEVMTDFWFNHFNVFINKAADRYLTTEYERDAIRKHALGNFKDLLLATAESPAMQFYLDNWQSIGPDSLAGQISGGQRPLRRFAGQGRGGIFAENQRGRFNESTAQRPPIARNGEVMMADGQPIQDPTPQQRPKRGLNENYARELMELHTLGVDGGYTQQDVIEVAKVFTGWTIKQPQRGGSFEFDERRHEPGSKLVLGHKISEDGMNEGKKVLQMLASHPSTAHFICKKLAMRFVSDDPPAALVDRMADTFLKKDGNIKEVLRTMFKSPEFWSPEAYRAKVKTPLEFVVSAVRATGADVTDARPLAQTLNKLGMPLYGMQPPTGYSMKAEAWVNSAALLNRMNFALQLGNGKMRGVSVQPAAMPGETSASDPDALVSALAGSLLSGELSQQTRNSIRKQLQTPENTPAQDAAAQARQVNPGLLAGLILGSPEFQRR